MQSSDRIPFLSGGLSTDEKIPLSAGAKRAVAFAAFVSSLTAATLGYDVGIVAAAIDYISDSMNLNHSQTQLVVGSLNFVSAFGTLIAGETADAFGRKTTVWLCCVFYTVGTVLMTFATNYEFLLLGRIVTGLGVGVSFVVIPVYISEITPSEYRGMLTTCFDVSINVGILLGYLVGYCVVVFGNNKQGGSSNMSDDFKWRLMLGLGGALPAIVMASLVKLPESPRWLMSKGRDAEATATLTWFYGDERVAQQTIADIKKVMDEDSSGLASLEVEGGGVAVPSAPEGFTTSSSSSSTGSPALATANGLLAVDSSTNAGGRSRSTGSDGSGSGSGTDQGAAKKAGHGAFPLSPSSSSSASASPSSPSSLAMPPKGGASSSSALTWREALWIDPLPASDAYLRKVILLVVGLGFWQQATGSEAVLYYSGSFLESAGLHSQEQKLLGYIAIGLCKLIPEALVMLVVDRSGRRPLLTGSSLGVTLVMFALAAAFSYTGSGTSGGGLVIFLLCVYMILFSLGMGPVTWVLSAEMLPSRARAKGMTLCSFVNRLVSGSVALTVLTTSDALGFSGFFLLYATLAAFATAWYWAYVPETKGKTLEEITATFRGEDEG